MDALHFVAIMYSLAAAMALFQGLFAYCCHYVQSCCGNVQVQISTTTNTTSAHLKHHSQARQCRGKVLDQFDSLEHGSYHGTPDGYCQLRPFQF